MTGIDSTIRLVLIDDDEGVLRALAMLLGTLGFKVHPFSSAREGVAHALESTEIDLVVSDLRMPGFSGEDVVRELRAQGSQVPIIIMSGHATSSDIEGLRSRGMSTFISKPFTPDKFVEIARSVLQAASKKNAA